MVSGCSCSEGVSENHSARGGGRPDEKKARQPLLAGKKIEELICSCCVPSSSNRRDFYAEHDWGERLWE